MERDGGRDYWLASDMDRIGMREHRPGNAALVTPDRMTVAGSRGPNFHREGGTPSSASRSMFIVGQQTPKQGD